MLRIDRTWLRPAPTRAQVRADVVVSVIVAVLAVVTVELFRSAYAIDLKGRQVEAYAWFGVAGLLLAGRRTIPLTVLVIEAAMFVIVGERFGELAAVFTFQMILFVAIYSAWAWSRRPGSLMLITAIVLITMFGWLASAFVRFGAPTTKDTGLISPFVASITYNVMLNLVYFVGAILWGHAAWVSARRRTEEAARVEADRRRLEAEQVSAVQAERMRIARDLHDVVAHHVSGIGVQAAGAARLLDARPDATRKALGTIETSARRAVTQMHQVVGLLRSAGDPEADRAPQPGLTDLAALVAEAGAAGGPAVRLTTVGEPVDLDPAVASTIYRVAQEALTNVRRHAAANSATVTLRWLDAPTAVEVEVIDDGRGPAAAPAAGSPSGGFGLTGIRERVATWDGEVEIGPRPHGGFRVRARIPLDSEPDVDPSPVTPLQEPAR